MRKNCKGLAGAVSLVAAVLLAGCPSSPKMLEIDIWLINGSANFSVTSVKISDTEKAKTTQELITDEGLPANMIRLLEGLDISSFEGENLTVTVTGHASGIGISQEVSVVVDGPLPSVMPILVTDSILSIGVRYVPLESLPASKSLLERICETVEF